MTFDPPDAKTLGAPLGPWDILSVPEVVKRLKIRNGDARRWLREQGLIRNVLGRERVLWGDVLRSLGLAEAEDPCGLR